MHTHKKIVLCYYNYYGTGNFISGNGVVNLNCGEAAHCPNETVTLSCQTTNCFLEWRLGSPHQELDFTCIDNIGEEESTTSFTANLTNKNVGIYRLTSLLSFKAEPSLDGIDINCVDGFDGSISNCTLNLLSNKYKILCILVIGLTV